MVTVWTSVVVVACMLLVGLVLDGGVILRGQSSTFDIAGGAARVGAQQLDQPALARGQVEIDPAAARQAVDRYLRTFAVAGTTFVSGDTITVEVHRIVRLQIVRAASLTITQRATAIANRGGS